MTENKRIVLNALASYGRSLFTLCLGMFSSRWILSAIGAEDYGLFGVTAGIIGIITLLNGLLSASVSRHYAYAIGASRQMAEVEGKEMLTRWFNSAISIHIILPLVLIVIGYPLGDWALRNWLVIPSARMDACLCSFRLSLLMAFFSMVSVPYIAFYQAKQLIAELSLWGVIQTSLTFTCTYFLRSWDGDRLIALSAYSSLVPVLIMVIQVLRARTHFPQCRIRRRYIFDFRQLKKIVEFAFGDFWGWFGSAVRDRGLTFMVNINYGPQMNASYALSDRVSQYTMALSNSLIGALVPAVTTAEGAGNHDRALRLSFSSIKFGVMLILIFAIPLFIEVDEVLRLWLINPPEYTGTLCRFILVALIVHKLGWGHHLALVAGGRILCYQFFTGLLSAGGLIIAWLLFRFGLGVESIGWAIVLDYIAVVLMRVYFGKRLCGMPVVYWIVHVVLPLFVLMLASGVVGCLPSQLLPPSFLRIVLTVTATMIPFAVVSWFIVCDADERRILSIAISKLVNRVVA